MTLIGLWDHNLGSYEKKTNNSYSHSCKDCLHKKKGGKSAILLLINMREKRVRGSPACVGQAGWWLEGEDNLVPGGAALWLAGSVMCGANGLM